MLDQLAGSAGTGGLTYERAAALLGYTPSALLHQVVEAVAAQDAPSLFAAIDAALDRGLEPWRFSGDLLDRLRDLLLLAQVDDAAERGLVHVPADELPAMRAQAAALGVGRLGAGRGPRRGHDERAPYDVGPASAAA